MESAQHALLSASCLGSPHAHLQALDAALFQGNPPTAATTLAHPALHLPAPAEHSWSSVSAASPEMKAFGAVPAVPVPAGALAAAGPPEFRCTEPDCGRIFKRKTSLTNHLKAHRNPNSRSLQRSKRLREAQRAKAKQQAGLAPPASASAPASHVHPPHAPPRNPCLAGIEAMGMLAATPASAPLPPPPTNHTSIDLKPAPIIKKPKRYAPHSPRLTPLLSRDAVKQQESAAALLHPLPLQLPIGSAAASTAAAQQTTTVVAPAPAPQHQGTLSSFTLPPSHQTLHHHLQYAQQRMHHQQQPSTNDRFQTLLPHSLHSLPIPSLSLHTASPYGIATSPVSATAGSCQNSNLPTHPTFASTANYEAVPTHNKYEGAQLHATPKHESNPTNGYGYSPAASRTPANPHFMEQPFEMPVGGSEAAIMGVAPCFTEEGGLLAPLDLNFLDDAGPTPTGAAVGRGTMEPPAHY